MRKILSNLKKTMLILMLVVFCVSPVLTGCDIDFNSSKKLKTPEISMSTTNKSLSWNKISGAENYDIYLNEEKTTTIDADDENRIVYDFSGLLGESGTYSFCVVATSSNIYIEDSDKSNTKSYEYTKKSIITPVTPDAEISGSEDIVFTVSSDGKLSFIEIAGIDDVTYTAYIYSSSTGLKSYNLPSTIVDLVAGNYVTKSEIYAIRMGYSYLENDSLKTSIASEIKYFNNISTVYEDYTNKIYLFDGEIHDYYIENQQELNNLVYYTFVNRIEEFNIRISDAFIDAITESYKKTSTLDNLNYAVYSSLRDGMYETISYSANNIGGGFASTNGSSYEYTIKISYGGVKECDINISPTKSSLYSQARSTGYWTTTNYTNLKTKYGEDYDDFVSDKQFLYTTVSTSEQLYWAVENKITPVFKNTTCRAYIIYNKAKEVLREIISDDMTDYEKALSIFDWIAINTSYDYTNYNSYTEDISNYPHKLPCFYLEGVFMTGYSVCDGFSKSFSLMCNMLGIDCIRIVGDANTGSSTGGHAWNKVLLDKDTTDNIPAQYYVVDITWTEMISGDNEEELSHTYFCISDSDIAETHIPHSGRNGKYYNYQAPDNLYYYYYHTFEYDDKEENLVIENTEEMEDLFDYLLVSNRDTIEIIIDYDYMVSVYNANNDKPYKSETEVVKEYYNVDSSQPLLKSEYDPATDTLTYYNYSSTKKHNITTYSISSVVTYNNYKLRTVFQEKEMKTKKFQEQYIFIVDENDLRTYADGKEGMLFIFTQNLLIDNSEEFVVNDDENYVINENGETAHIVSNFDEREITGTYYLYIENVILNKAEGTTLTQKINSMFNTFETENVKFEFEFVSDNELSGSSVSSSLFKMTVSSK